MTAAAEADFRWALVGPGRVAQRFAEAVTRLPGTCLHAVHGRSGERSASFAAAWPQGQGRWPAVVDDLDALLADAAVNAVYIATPHTLHADAVRRCLLAGKPVLCEKPLVPTQAQAQDLVQLAQQRGVFLMEAMWTRFLPLYERLLAALQAGAIGELRALQSSFCFAVPQDPASRLFDPALAGGTLLDIGIYNLAVTRMVLDAAWGHCPEPLVLQATGLRTPSGVDLRVAATLQFQRGVVSQFVCAFDSVADNTLHIAGSGASVCVQAGFWQATQAVLRRPGRADVAWHAPMAINGFEGQIAEAMHCIRAGAIESPRWPHAQTLALLGWIDTLRAQLGVRYPFEAAGR